MLASTLQRLAGLRPRDEDGQEQILELQAPATEAEVRTLEAGLPCPIPDDIRAALQVSLPPTALVVDLRHPQLGQGFSWGRFGPRTAIRRAGEEPIWALMPPERKPGLFATLFRGRRGSA